MKTRELRIGNLLINGDRIVIVSATFKSHFNCEILESKVSLNSAQNNFQPIPLTEEWLIKFGFKKYISDDNDIDINFQISFHNKSSEGLIVQLFMNSNGVIFFSHSGISLFSVHSLQNLYFSLTGEELKQQEQ